MLRCYRLAAVNGAVPSAFALLLAQSHLHGNYPISHSPTVPSSSQQQQQQHGSDNAWRDRDVCGGAGAYRRKDGSGGSSPSSYGRGRSHTTYRSSKPATHTATSYGCIQEREVQVQQPTTHTLPSMSGVPSTVSTHYSRSTAPASTDTDTARPCFWSQPVRHVPAGEVKRQHIIVRAEDKRSRFLVRSRIRDDGVLSNLFPLSFPGLADPTAASGTAALKPSRPDSSATPADQGVLYVYEMYVTRVFTGGLFTSKNSSSSNGTAGGGKTAWKAKSRSSPYVSVTPTASFTGEKNRSKPVERRVPPGRSWNAIQRYLRHRFSNTAGALLPPLVQSENKIYAAGPLPADALELPRTYYDIGWKTAELRLLSRTRYVDLPPGELQVVLNKIVLEVARDTYRQQQRARQHPFENDILKRHRDSNTQGSDASSTAWDCGALEVVRGKTGKLVCTMQGVSSGGLRVYRGIYVQAVFVDDRDALAYTDAESEERKSVEGESGTNTKEAGANGPSDTTADGQVATTTDTANTAASPAPCALTSRYLAETPVGLTDAATHPPIPFQVDAFLRAFTYKGTPVESYRIHDASGTFLASVWAPPSPQLLKVGGVYAASPVRIREFAERNNARLIELPSGTQLRLLSGPPPATQDSVSESRQSFTSAAAAGAGKKASALLGRGATAGPAAAPPSRLPGHISLKIDTKGTIASEVSLWDEVLQHYGAGPYDESTQQRIRKSLAHMPIVISYSLRQGIVRDVRFDGEALLAAAATGSATVSAMTSTVRESTDNGVGSARAQNDSANDLAYPPSAVIPADAIQAAASRTPALGLCEPRLLPLLPRLDPRQPCAVLADHTVVPLQVLHCCFDPSMRGWQDISVAVLSLMPNQRMELLAFVQHLLQDGLTKWGICLARQPWRTKVLSVLPAPMKVLLPRAREKSGVGRGGGGRGRGEAALTFPTTVLVLGIAGTRCTADQLQRVTLTTQHTARYFRTNLVACVADEAAGVQFIHDQLMQPQAPTATHTNTAFNSSGFVTNANAANTPTTVVLRDPNACVILITTEPNTRATRWLKVECLSRGIHLIALPPSSAPKKLNLLCSSLRRQLCTQFELNPLRGIDLRAEVPVLGDLHVLIIGVDTCHTNTHSVGTIVGILSTPTDTFLLSHFWRHNARGSEVSHVALHFKNLLQRALVQYGRIDEVVIFQDGDVFSELAGVKEELAAHLPACGLTFMCLHKRCNIRFIHTCTEATAASTSATVSSHSAARHPPDYHNMVKGVVVTALAPVPLDCELAAPSFYLQTHESAMSTARAVQYTVHHVSPTLDVADVQQMANVMANVMAPQATKLPMSTRCAHRLADRAERLLDAVPQFSGEMIPRPLCDRLWFL